MDAIDPNIFLAPIHSSDMERFRGRARRALKESGPIPKVTWGLLVTHKYQFRWTIPTSTPSEIGPSELEKFIEHGFKSVGRCDESLSRAIERIVTVLAATFYLETQPTIERLDEVATWLDRYKELRAEPAEQFEDWYAENFYSEARARHRAWQARLNVEQSLDERFAFVAEYIYPSDLHWAMDPLVCLDEFHTWAKNEIRERRVTKPQEEFRGHRPDMSPRWYKTRPDNEMTAINVGRLLAAQLSGLDVASTAASLMDVKENTKPMLVAMLETELDPNAVDSRDGEPILHAAARQNNAMAIKLLLEAGADPTIKHEKKTAKSVAGSRGKKAFDEFEKKAKPKPTQKPKSKPAKPKQPPRIHSFHDYGGFAETTYAALADAHKVRNLSDNIWFVDDLFGSEPNEVTLRHDGDLRWDSHFNVIPDDYGYLVVHGNLEVNGTFSFECVDFANVIVITGDLVVENLIVQSESHLYVLGDTRITNTAAFNMGPAGACRFFGDITGALFVQLGEETVDCEKGAPEAYGVDFLKPAFVEDEIYPKDDEIWTAIRQNKPIIDP